jgi:hypothetical protein
MRFHQPLSSGWSDNATRDPSVVLLGLSLIASTALALVRSLRPAERRIRRVLLLTTEAVSLSDSVKRTGDSVPHTGVPQPSAAVVPITSGRVAQRTARPAGR